MNSFPHNRSVDEQFMYLYNLFTQRPTNKNLDELDDALSMYESNSVVSSFKEVLALTDIVPLSAWKPINIEREIELRPVDWDSFSSDVCEQQLHFQIISLIDVQKRLLKRAKWISTLNTITQFLRRSSFPTALISGLTVISTLLLSLSTPVIAASSLLMPLCLFLGLFSCLTTCIHIFVSKRPLIDATTYKKEMNYIVNSSDHIMAILNGLCDRLQTIEENHLQK